MTDHPASGDPPGSLLGRALHRLHPRDARNCPALFLLETCAALLTVLGFRTVLLGTPGASGELFCAAALWAAALAAACAMPGQR